MIFCWPVSTPITSPVSRALQSVSSGALHLFALLCGESGWHVSRSSLRNSVSLHHAFPSQNHPLNRNVHLDTATLPGNTSERVNGILVEL